MLEADPVSDDKNTTPSGQVQSGEPTLKQAATASTEASYISHEEKTQLYKGSFTLFMLGVAIMGLIGTMTAAQTVTLNIVNKRGSDYGATYSVLIAIMAFFKLVFGFIFVGLTPIVGSASGAGDNERVGQLVRVAIPLCSLCGIIGGIFIHSARVPLLELFSRTEEDRAMMVELGKESMSWMAFGFFLDQLNTGCAAIMLGLMYIPQAIGIFVISVGVMIAILAANVDKHGLLAFAWGGVAMEIVGITLSVCVLFVPAKMRKMYHYFKWSGSERAAVCEILSQVGWGSYAPKILTGLGGGFGFMGSRLWKAGYKAFAMALLSFFVIVALVVSSLFVIIGAALGPDNIVSAIIDDLDNKDMVSPTIFMIFLVLIPVQSWAAMYDHAAIAVGEMRYAGVVSVVCLFVFLVIALPGYAALSFEVLYLAELVFYILRVLLVSKRMHTLGWRVCGTCMFPRGVEVGKKWENLFDEMNSGVLFPCRRLTFFFLYLGHALGDTFHDPMVIRMFGGGHRKEPADASPQCEVGKQHKKDIPPTNFGEVNIGEEVNI